MVEQYLPVQTPRYLQYRFQNNKKYHLTRVLIIRISVYKIQLQTQYQLT